MAAEVREQQLNTLCAKEELSDVGMSFLTMAALLWWSKTKQITKAGSVWIHYNWTNTLCYLYSCLTYTGAISESSV